MRKSIKQRSPSQLLVTIPEAAAMLSIGRTKLTELIAAKSLPTVRIGRSVRIPVASLQKWVEQEMSAC